MWQTQTQTSAAAADTKDFCNISTESNISRNLSTETSKTAPEANSKSVCDSFTDSGFHSGSNLLSSGPLDERIMPTDNISSISTSVTSVGGEGSKSCTVTSCLDSGIDISEQLSSLQLRSGPSCSSATISSTSLSSREGSSREVDDDTTTSTLVQKSHVSLLQEIFSPDEDGDTQLHVAVMRGFVEVVYHITRLLPHQAFLDLVNNTGRTALHLAVGAGNAGVVRHLIVCGASPVARDRRGYTPLHSACHRGDLNLVVELTRPVTVAEVSKAKLAYAPAHTAGLLAADLNDYQGQTCIHIAAQVGSKESKDIIQHLTWYGADVNAKEGRSGRTALHYAVEARDPDLVAHLATACRAALTPETYAGLSPYQLALANGATDLATFLLDLGAPAQLLPAAYTRDDDDALDYPHTREDASSDTEDMLNGWSDVDDIRIAGHPLHPPVSTAAHTIDADLYL